MTRTTAAFLADARHLLILGAAEAPPPDSGAVEFGEGGRAGSFATVVWRAGEGLFSFLALLDRDDIALDLHRGPVLVAEGGARLALSEVTAMPLDPAPLVADLKDAAGPSLPAVVAFLRRFPAATRVLFALLEATARLDGFVEVFGRTQGTAVMLQGWARGLPAGAAELIVDSGRCEVLPAVVATYDRPDLGGGAQGVVMLAQPAAALDLRAVRRVYFRREAGYHQLDIFENRRFLDDGETAGHVKGMLDGLRVEPAAAKLFKRLGLARFEGHETLSALPVPARAALDLAVRVPGAGVYLSGWLLDPEDRVASVTLRGPGGLASRIDDRWSRTTRRDVSQGFASDPLFAGRIRPGADDHGFLVFVPCAEAAESGLHLEFALADDEFAFVPVPAGTAPSGDLIRRILSGFNISDPAIERIVGRQIGPIVAASARGLGGAARVASLCPFGDGLRAPPRISAIIPVLRDTADFDVTMARLAVDPEFAAVELVVVAPSRMATVLGPFVNRHAHFYGLSGRLVLTAEEFDQFEGLEIGARHATSDLLLFLSGSVLPLKGGWLSVLARHLGEAARGCAISPTLVYEDNSIKYAGARSRGWAPARNRDSLVQYAGYARHWLAGRASARGSGVVPVHAVTADCCLLHRSAFDAVGGFSKEFVGPEFKALDLSLKFRAARLQCLWAPGVELVALDDAPAGGEEYWRQAGRLVDRWGFDRKWAQQMGQGAA